MKTRRVYTAKGRMLIAAAIVALASLATCTLVMVPSRFGPVGW